MSRPVRLHRDWLHREIDRCATWQALCSLEGRVRTERAKARVRAARARLQAADPPTRAEIERALGGGQVSEELAGRRLPQARGARVAALRRLLPRATPEQRTEIEDLIEVVRRQGKPPAPRLS